MVTGNIIDIFKEEISIIVMYGESNVTRHRWMYLLQNQKVFLIISGRS